MVLRREEGEKEKRKPGSDMASWRIVFSRASNGRLCSFQELVCQIGSQIESEDGFGYAGYFLICAGWVSHFDGLEYLPVSRASGS